MPSDIRSFFGAKPAGTPSKTAPAKEEKSRKRGRQRKVVSDDDDDDDGESGKATQKSPAKRAKKALSPAPALEETTADHYFAQGRKPRRTEPSRPATQSKPKEETEKPNGVIVTPKKSARETTSARSSARKTKPGSYVELNEDEFPDEVDVDDVGRSTKSKKKKDGRTKDDEDFVVPDDNDDEIVEKSSKRGGKKRKHDPLDDDDESEDLEIEEKVKPTKKRATPSKKSTPAKKQKAEAPQDSSEIQAIFDSIPTIDPPPPPPKKGDGDAKPKFQYGQHANSAVPAGALDSSDIPNGADNCLAGLSFVFTGQLQRLGREQGQNLVKQYGGKVTGAPSKKTSYVVLGEDAGPKKLETIQTYGLKVVNEDGLFELIRRLPANGGDSAAAAKNAEKRAEEEDKIRKAAEEIERQERSRLAAAKPKMQSSSSSAGATASQKTKGKASAAGPDTRLWTVRYAPQQLTQICGNKAQVEKLQRWLRAFPKNQRTKFKMPGPDGSGTFRAVMIHGPPGIGKTTAAHLVAKLEGYDIVESNASDTRSKKLVETGLKGVLSTTSLMGYFGGAGGADVDVSKKRLVLIMDEVDGMSAGDRGGVGALASVCKKTQIPMILICNDRKLPKMKPFDFVTYDIPFRRPTVDMIRSRIMTIAYREGLQIPANVVNALIEGSGADIRQVVNMISTAKLDTTSLSFEDGKDMSKAWEKHIILKPWDMVGKILGGGLFNPASKSTLNDKQELYFNDHEFAPLMLQENYLGTNPARTLPYNADAKRKRLATLDLVSRAADAISDGDLVDRMIHGPQQHWALMPTHALFAFVRPASFVHGSMAGNQTRFTTWLGRNSTQGRLQRVVKELQGHMRLRVSADRFEVRQSYLPLLFDRLVRRLQTDGKPAVSDIIALMDEYYLTKDDWDGIMELGVGSDDMETVKIESQAKATFTRQYNQMSHPLPFIKASQVVQPKRAPAHEKPDLEEAFDESDEGEAAAALTVDDEVAAAAKDDDADEEVDLTKDKYVRVPKKRKTAATTAKAPKAGKAKKRKKAGDGGDDESPVEDDEEDEEEAPKKKSAKGKGKGKAKK